jgi:hypothetical protein
MQMFASEVLLIAALSVRARWKLRKGTPQNINIPAAFTVHCVASSSEQYPSI